MSVSQATVEQAITLLKKCDAADATKEDRAALTRLIGQGELWRIGGDLARLAREAMLKTYFVQYGVRQSAAIGMDKMRAELASPEAPLMERLLAEEITLAWGALHIAQYQASKASSTQAGKYWTRQVMAMQRRYLRAVETLARVRRLLRPGLLQVNIGQTVHAAQIPTVIQGNGK